MKWWEVLLNTLVNLLTTNKLESLGATHGEASAGLTGMVNLPTFGEDMGAEELRQRADLVSFMREQLGKTYHLGVEVTNREHDSSEWDCSELTEAAYRLVHLMLPDGAQQQFDATDGVNKPRGGDLGFLWSDKRGMIGHVMMHTGEGTVVHAVGGRGVVEDEIERWETHPRWRGWRRHNDFSRPPEERV